METAGRGRAAFALFCFVFCCRAWLIRLWGSAVPYWDQWDAEALGLFRPWINGTLHWADLFRAHNEHRIVLTRLADLALFLVEGNWNPWWQMLLNALLHAGVAGAVAWIGWPGRTGWTRAAWLLGPATLFAVPAGWQNALWGFQSQVYFGELFSVLALGGLLCGEIFGGYWWLGWLAAGLALLANGAGVLAAIAAFLVNGAFFFFPHPTKPALAATELRQGSAKEKLSSPPGFGLLATGLLIGAGFLLQAKAPQHDPLHAGNAAQFFPVFFRCLSWPWVDSAGLWLVLQAPLLWLAVGFVRRRVIPTPAVRFAFGLGLLAVLHAAAVAYSRGAGLVDARPLSRYQDPLILGVAANLLVLLEFTPTRSIGRICAFIWTGTLLAGVLTLTTTNLSLHLPFKRAQSESSLSQIRSYVAHHDPAVLIPKIPALAAHPNPAVMQEVLDDPKLQAVLPREFFDSSIHPPWLVEFSPWLVIPSIVGLLLTAAKCGRMNTGAGPRRP